MINGNTLPKQKFGFPNHRRRALKIRKDSIFQNRKPAGLNMKTPETFAKNFLTP